MKKENLILVLCFVSMFILGIILVSIQTVLPSTQIDKMFNQKVTIENQVEVMDTDYINIRTKADVISLDDKKLADIYTINVNHKSYFDLVLYVAIDKEGNVYAIDKEVVTKDSTSESYFKLVREYLLQNYNGLYYQNVQFVDGAAGATTIGVSRSMIKNAVSQVVLYHNGDVVDHIADLFGTKEYTLNSTSTVDGISIMDVTVAGVNYNVYKNEGVGTYYDQNAVEEGSITILIALDADKNVTNVSVPEDVYGHTGGNFYNNSKLHLETYLGLNIVEDIVDYTSQPTDNSDGSKYLIDTLLLEIKEVA